MDLPPFPTITPDALQAIATRHQLASSSATATFTLLPQVGIVNKIYQVDDEYILRIGRDHPKSFSFAQVEATVVPMARAAGVRTPELLVMDDSCEILAVPYTIFQG